MDNLSLKRYYFLMEYDTSKTYDENLRLTEANPVNINKFQNNFMDDLVNQNKLSQRNKSDATYNTKLSKTKYATEHPPSPGIFGQQGDLWGTPKPEPPVQETSISQSGGLASKKFNWAYSRYENKVKKEYKFNDYYKGPIYNKYYDRFEKDLKNWTMENTWVYKVTHDPHVALQVSSMAALLIPVIGPALSSGLQLADSSLYYSEGNNYEAGLTAVFALIPASKYLIPSIKKISTKGLAKVLKVLSNGGKDINTLSSAEKTVANEIVQSSSELARLAKIGSVKLKIFNALVKAKGNVKGFLNFAKTVKLNYPKLTFLVGTGMEVGGVFYGYDKLYNYYETLQRKHELAKTKEEKQKIEKIQNEINIKLEQKRQEIVEKTKKDQEYEKYVDDNLIKYQEQTDSLCATINF